MCRVGISDPFAGRGEPVVLGLTKGVSTGEVGGATPGAVPVLRRVLGGRRKSGNLVRARDCGYRRCVAGGLCGSELVSRASGGERRVLSFFRGSRGPLILISPSVDRNISLPCSGYEFRVVCGVPFPCLNSGRIGVEVGQSGG